jgi:tetratricopeptide (TPR) repeat protein
MFFPRLRRQAKWAFAGMVLVFALAFVVAGVGSGSSIGDLLQGHLFGGGSSGPSIGKSRERVAKNPRNARAWHDLALAYEAKQRDADAITSLRRYLKLKPADKSVLEELASLQIARGQRLSQQANALYQAQQQANPGQQFQADPNSKLGQALGTDPITQSLTGGSTTYTTVFADAQTAFTGAVSTYKKLVKLDPSVATTQENLGNAALFAGDAKTANLAYRHYLKLAPDAADAPDIRQEIKRLKAQRAAP